MTLNDHLRQYGPGALLVLIVLSIIGMAFTRMSPRASSGIALPTAAILDPSDVPSPAAPVPTAAPTAPPVGAMITVGFAPGTTESTIAFDTPRTFLGPVEWVNGEKHCFISVAYVDEGNVPHEAEVWGACAALAIDAPDPTPVPQPASAPVAPPPSGAAPPQAVEPTATLLTPLDEAPPAPAAQPSAPPLPGQLATSQSNPQGCAATTGGGRCNALPIPTTNPAATWPSQAGQP